MKGAIITIGLVVSLHVFAQRNLQEGFIINNQDDTLYGYIEKKSIIQHGYKCFFTLNEDSQIIQYTPHEIKAYRFIGDNYYVSHSFLAGYKNDTAFLDFLVNGIINLYYYEGEDTEYYFFAKDADLITISRKKSINKCSWGQSEKYKKDLRNIFSQAPEIEKTIDNTAFSYKSFIHVTKTFHQQTLNDYIIYPDIAFVLFFVGAKSGVSHNVMKYRQTGNKARSTYGSYGFNARFVPSLSNKNWNFLMDFIYSSFTINGKVIKEIDQLIIGNEVLFKTKYNMLRIPFFIQYLLPLGNIRPTIACGYDNIFIINPAMSVKQVIETPPDIETIYSLPSLTSPFKDYIGGFIIAPGVRYNMSDKLNFSLIGEFELSGAPQRRFKLERYSTRSYSLYFMIGYNIF